MALGNEWEEEKKMAIEKGEDAEKMLRYYIYNHMKKKNLHDVAEIYAQEANLEISHLERCEESLLTKWWELFWPTFCSRLSNEAGANAESSGQLATVNALAMLASLNNQGASSSRQTPMDPQQDVLPVIANNVMSQGFAGNTPIIPNLNNVMQENHVSTLLPLLERNQQATRGLYNCDNVIAQSPAEFLSTPGIYQRRTGKLPMNIVSNSIQGQLSANPLLVKEAFGNERLGFAPVQLLPGQVLGFAPVQLLPGQALGFAPVELLPGQVLGFAPVELLLGQSMVGADSLYSMPPSGSQSHLQLPALTATMELPAEVIKDPKNEGLGRFGNMELSCPVGPNSTFATVADHAGPSNWMNQLPATGLGTAVPGPDLFSYQSRVPDTFLQYLHLAAEECSRFYQQ